MCFSDGRNDLAIQISNTVSLANQTVQPPVLAVKAELCNNADDLDSRTDDQITFSDAKTRGLRQSGNLSDPQSQHASVQTTDTAAGCSSRVEAKAEASSLLQCINIPAMNSVQSAVNSTISTSQHSVGNSNNDSSGRPSSASNLKVELSWKELDDRAALFAILEDCVGDGDDSDLIVR